MKWNFSIFKKKTRGCEKSYDFTYLYENPDLDTLIISLLASIEENFLRIRCTFSTLSAYHTAKDQLLPFVLEKDSFNQVERKISMETKSIFDAWDVLKTLFPYTQLPSSDEDDIYHLWEKGDIPKKFLSLAQVEQTTMEDRTDMLSDDHYRRSVAKLTCFPDT